MHGGHDNIFPKVEEAIHGKKIGDKVAVALEPIDAFGDYNEELVQIEPASAFPEKSLKEGMQFEGEDSSGEVIVYTITDIADGKVVVDGNHPWAGQKVIFEAVIKDVRDASHRRSYTQARSWGGRPPSLAEKLKMLSKVKNLCRF